MSAGSVLTVTCVCMGVMPPPGSIKKAGRDETYNYYYARAELEGIRQRAETLRCDSRSLTVVANNHFQAKEVTNILQLKAMMTSRKVPVPPGLLARYPELKDIAVPDTV